ncbi:18901_t:CDS:2, partial [Entrophospora sp. SA101]
ISKKSEPISRLNKDFEYLNYRKDLDRIITGYRCGTTWNKIAVAAKRNLQSELNLSLVKNFWLLQDQEIAADRRGASQAYETGNNYLLHTSSINSFTSSTSTPPIVTATTGNSNDEGFDEPNHLLLGKRSHRDEESVEIDEMIIDYTKYPLLKRYRSLLSDLQQHPVEEESQRACHAIRMIKWYVVDKEILKELDGRLLQAEQPLQKLITKNRVRDSDHNWLLSPITSIIETFRDSGRGSARSDFAAIVTNHNVVVSEAAHEFNRMLTLARNLSEEEINRTCIHNGLVNGTQISFIVYLRETVCEDGLCIKTILEREPTRHDYKLKALLPRLPNEVAKSRTYSTNFTPHAKKQRYIFLRS